MREILKKFYFIFFSIYKYYKYPTCKINTNLIFPGVKIGKYVWIKKHSVIGGGVEIGDFTFVNEYSRIDSNTKSIGKFCSISHNVKIGMGPHPLNYISTSPVLYLKRRKFVTKDLYDEFKDKGYTKIGNDVLIGANAIIMAGVNVENGAVVAAGSIVTKDVPPYAIVAGNPAKVLKYRFSDDIITKLLEIEWWNSDYSILKQKMQYFSDIKKFINSFNV